jgi:hypothetical protein
MSLPEWYGEALERMKQLRRYGLVLVVPDGASERAAFAERLYEMFQKGGVEQRLLHCETVFVCVTLGIAREAGLDATKNRFLLSPEGKVLASAAAPASVFDSEALFLASFEPFVHGATGERLQERAEDVRARATEDERNALLLADSEESRDWAREVLESHADRLMPLLAWAHRRLATEEGRQLVYEVMEHYSWTGDTPFEPAGTLLIPPADPCVGCGMPSMNDQAREFTKLAQEEPLRFLEE